MITLQTLLPPDREICTEQPLYAHANGAFGFSQSRGVYLLGRGAELIFDTYFNAFDLNTWTRRCDLDDLYAEIAGVGQVGLYVWHVREGRSWDVIYSEVVTLASGAPHLIDLSSYADGSSSGVLFLTLKALDDEVTFEGGRFATHGQPKTLPELAISITTFRREKEVRRTVQRLEEFLEGFAYSDHIRVQVVDNGQSAEIETRGKVTVYSNANLGGAGGFSRGLLEAEAAGASHCLFMDDDASFHMENITRAYMLLAYAKNPATALSGAMITNTHKWRMWENGAWFDGSCHPMFNGVDLREAHEVFDMMHEADRFRTKPRYGGWWFFAFPIQFVRHYPFPFFVRGDDINFSLANEFEILTLNGVVSFQDDFSEKESAQTLYLDLRNHLVQHLTIDRLARSPLGTARVALFFIMRSLVRMHYATAEAQLMAWEDVMQGPQFFAENIDMAERRAIIKEMAEEEAWQPIDILDFEEQRRGIALKSRQMRHRWGMMTLNGHLVPWFRGSRLVLDANKRSNVFQTFGAREVTFLNTNRDKAYTVKHSKRRFFAIVWKMTRLIWRFNRDFSRIRAAYRDGYEPHTSKAFWRKHLTS